jgi:hypothetical protein
MGIARLREGHMSDNDIEQALLKHHGLRITPAMSEYILAKLKESSDSELPIIAGDAKTGVPVRAVIPLATLQNYASAQS